MDLRSIQQNHYKDTNKTPSIDKLKNELKDAGFETTGKSELIYENPQPIANGTAFVPVAPVLWIGEGLVKRYFKFKNYKISKNVQLLYFFLP